MNRTHCRRRRPPLPSMLSLTRKDPTLGCMLRTAGIVIPGITPLSQQLRHYRYLAVSRVDDLLDIHCYLRAVETK